MKLSFVMTVLTHEALVKGIVGFDEAGRAIGKDPFDLVDSVVTQLID